MGKKVLYLVNVISGIAFFVAISECMTLSIMFSCLLGLVLGLIEYAFLINFRPKFNKIFFTISIVSGGIISFFAAKDFHDRWITSEDFVRTVVTKVFPDFDFGMLIVSIALGIVILPFASCMIGMLPTLVKALRLFDYKKIWTEFKDGLTFSVLLKKTGIVIVNLLAATLVGTLLLYLVYLLPVDKIEANVASSAQTIAAEGCTPTLYGWATSKVDNYTDSIMLLESAYPQHISPLVDAMNAPNGSIGDLEPYDYFISHYINGINYDSTYIYPRYWHGYLIFLKPLLLLTNYSTLRTINGIVQAITVLLTCFLLYKKGHKKSIIPYILSFLMLMPIIMAMTFQYSSCFYVFTFGCIALLLLNDEKRRKLAPLVFLWCGIATAYFDFLTYPISTFGIPMVFYLMLEGKNPAESKLAMTVRNAIYWCFGLGVMWVSKWVIASIITGENKFKDAFDKFAQRASTSDDYGGSYSIYATELRNFGAFILTPVTALAVIFILYMIIRLIKQKKHTTSSTIRTLFPFMLIGFAPVVWYAFATNHSMIHYWFTNKACVVTFLAIVFGLVCLESRSEKIEA